LRAIAMGTADISKNLRRDATDFNDTNNLIMGSRVN
jgi:hypothetical protein